MLVMPVSNGILPRPGGGQITGMFLMEHGGDILAALGPKQDILICPWLDDRQTVYPVGVVARCLDSEVQVVSESEGDQIAALLTVLEGREHARWHTLYARGQYIYCDDVDEQDFVRMRKEYPVISGAGWLPAGGYTEFRADTDIPVTIYGNCLENGEQISITANLGGLVKTEQAHTIEHAVIRSLRTYGLCTPRTLLESIEKETAELKQSVETSIRFALPEILGVTASGACGNPMTNLAHFCLAKEFVENVAAGRSLNDSLLRARQRTMSRLSQDFGISMDPQLRPLQGLKWGMSHDDTPLKLEICKKVIRRFPFEPWG